MSKLNRTIGWKTYGLFGLGNIIGAGIYVLIGEVAGKAGNGAIWSFIVAGLVAGFTVVSYSALATKFPLSAGEVVYVVKSFNARNLGLLIGITLVFSGIVSGGALLNGFANYASQLLQIPKPVYILAAAIILSVVAIKGIKETAKLAVAITLIEVVGLLIIVGASLLSSGFSTRAVEVLNTSLDIGALPILLGGFLAFYAFIGFEDMVNVAEEVKNPTKNIKKGMFAAVTIAIVLYILVIMAALTSVPAAQLAESDAPLSTVFQRATNTTFPLIAIIGVFAIINGVLAQIVMGSRVLYGLSREKLILNWFGKVNSTTKTPINSTILMGVLMLVAAISLPLVALASLTSLALLVIFSIVHASCLKLRNQINIKPWIPATGLVLNTGIIIIQTSQWFNWL